MLDVFMDALIDSAKMIPFLLLIYVMIELLEYKFGSTIKEKVKKAKKTGVLLGAGFGCVPQCGFSVISTALYTKRVISVGTLLAVYLSTSDEAIPVILSQPDKVGVIGPLLLTKVVLAIVAGYSVDFVLSRSKKHEAHSEVCVAAEGADCAGTGMNKPGIEDKGCCGHSCTTQKFNLKEFILHPVIHTLKVFAFIFAVSLLINLIIFQVGEENLGNVFLSNSILQPVIAGLIGLIPNCASSVAITEVFLRGGLSFGSTIAGLSAGAGLGIIVLFKENRNMKDSLRIIGLLYVISVVAGIIIQTVYG